MRTLFLMAVVLGLGGCAANYREPDLPADHPANPSAESATTAEPSRTLSITVPASAAQSAGMQQHQGHGAEPSPQPAPHEHGAPAANQQPAAAKKEGGER